MIIESGHLTLAQLRRIAHFSETVQLCPSTFAAIDASAQAVENIVRKGKPVYGVNTGFGRLASTHIPLEQLDLLQRNLVLSHAVGVGEPMSRSVVRLMIVLKVSSLARGHSGIRREVIAALVTLLNADVLPVIPVKGSVGASGDLAPLAHMSAVLLGVGEVTIGERRASANEGLHAAGLEPFTLRAKEGLALLNGTQASTALALFNMFAIEDLFCTALVAGALSVDAAAASVVPFDARIHALRGHQGQIDSAAAYRALLEGSEINLSHSDCDKVQDPYSLRCQPQVMGACLHQMRHSAEVLLCEANSVSDNPLIFPDTCDVLSGGNFHAEPVAFAADNLALAVAEIGALAERRIALLIDTTLSGLPPFLVRDSGLNSGFMIAHVTAAALASENKTLAHPASVDSLPTSANQEDHVSMATFAARKLGDMASNTAHILAIELLAATQGIDLREPHRTSMRLQSVTEAVRRDVGHYHSDRHFSPDIAAIAAQVLNGEIARHSPFRFPSNP
nr:histidine ammonia-lyase [Paraburkholderia xenovorans]